MHKWNESNILKPFNSDKIRWMYRFHVPDFMLMFFYCLCLYSYYFSKHLFSCINFWAEKLIWQNTWKHLHQWFIFIKVFIIHWSWEVLTSVFGQELWKVPLSWGCEMAAGHYCSSHKHCGKILNVFLLKLYK